jgi:poly(A) polymerase
VISLIIDCRNSSDLPSDLFEEGEVKPARKQKKKVTNGAAKKRPAPEVCNLLHLSMDFCLWA